MSVGTCFNADRRRWGLGALVLAASLAGGCGTRVERQDAALPQSPASPLPAAASPGADQSSAVPAGAAVTQDAGGAAPTAAAVANGSQSTPAAAPSGRSTPTPSTSAAQNAGRSGRTPGLSSQPQAKGTPGTASGTPSPPQNTVAPPKVPAPRAGGSPIVVASVGTWSGPVGSSLKPILDGAQLWVKTINQRGGVNGHAVNLLVYDDNGDPARHRAQVQEAIEQRKVIGFLSNGETITGGPSVEYINSKRVPVIGTDGGENWPFTSPMYFPSSSTGDALYGTFLPSLAQVVIPEGKKKLGTVVCELSTCQEIEKVLLRDAKPVGFDHAYRGQASVAQPDYTAECLAARNAGVDVMFLILDTNSITRFVASCTRQGYRPRYGAATALVADRFKDDPNFEGFVAGTPVFPYFQTSTPASNEFQQARAAYGKGMALHIGLGVGWTSGKLLERAAASLPEPPTSQALLEGLWSIRNDTLGGITMPLTFTRDKPPVPLSCWFLIQVRKGEWTTPNGFKQQCR